MACLQSKGSIPWFLNYSKTLNSGVAPEIDPATIRSADKRRTAWATPAAVITRGGGGLINKVLCGEDPPRGWSNPLSFYIPFLTEKVPLSYTFF